MNNAKRCNLEVVMSIIVSCHVDALYRELDAEKMQYFCMDFQKNFNTRGNRYNVRVIRIDFLGFPVRNIQKICIMYSVGQNRRYIPFYKVFYRQLLHGCSYRYDLSERSLANSITILPIYTLDT